MPKKIGKSEFITELKPADKNRVGRDDEINGLLQVLNRNHRHHPVVLGTKGSGRTTVVQGLIQRLSDKTQIKRFPKFVFHYLDVRALLVSPKFSDAVLEDLFAFFYQQPKHTVLIVDGLDHDILELETLHQCITFLQRLLLSQKIQLISICDEDFFDTILLGDIVFEEQCAIISIPDLSESDIQSILKSKSSEIRKKYQLTFGTGSLDFVIKMAARFYRDMSLLLASSNLLDSVCSSLYVEKTSKQVTIKQIARYVAHQFGLNATYLSRPMVDRLQDFLPTIGEKIYGHKQSLQMIDQELKLNAQNLIQDNQPLATFLFSGLENLGKTTTVYAMAEFLYGGPLVETFNLLDYEDSLVFTDELFGSIESEPNQIFLLKNIDLASDAIMEAILSIVTGRNADAPNLKDSIIILSANSDVSQMDMITPDEELSTSLNLFDLVEESSDLLPSIKKNEPSNFKSILQQFCSHLSQTFQADLINHVTIVPFLPLSPFDLEPFMIKILQELDQTLFASYAVHIEYDERFVQSLLNLLPNNRITVDRSKHLIKNRVLPAIAAALRENIEAGIKITKLYLYMGIDSHCVCDWE